MEPVMMEEKAKKGKKKGGGKNREPQPPRRDPNERALSMLYGERGVNAGNALINKFLPEGALGRVYTDVGATPAAVDTMDRYNALNTKFAGRDDLQTDVLARMKGGLEGYTSPEYQAQREQMQRGLSSNLQTSLSQLAKSQARGKVYGAAATAQAGNMARAAQQTKDTLEQDLMVKNIDEKQRRLFDYGQYGRGLTEEEYGRQAESTKLLGDEARKVRDETLEREKINLGQSNAEIAAQIGAFTGAGSTSLSERNLEEQRKIQRRALKSLNR